MGEGKITFRLVFIIVEVLGAGCQHWNEEVGTTPRVSVPVIKLEQPRHAVLMINCGGRGRLYTYHYTVTTRMTSALRWAAMRAILMFQKEVMDKVTRLSTNHNLFEEKGEPKRYRTEVLPLTARPNRLAMRVMMK